MSHMCGTNRPEGSPLPLRHGSPLPKPFIIPAAVAQNAGQGIDGPSDIVQIVVQRRETKAQHVGRAEIADDARRDQRLHDGIALGVAEADLRSAPGRIARGIERHGWAACLDPGDEGLGQHDRPGAQVRQADIVPDIQGRVERGQLLLLEAFGGGFTWGSALLRY